MCFFTKESKILVSRLAFQLNLCLFSYLQKIIKACEKPQISFICGFLCHNQFHQSPYAVDNSIL